MITSATTASPESVRNRRGGPDASEARDWFSYRWIEKIVKLHNNNGMEAASGAEVFIWKFNFYDIDSTTKLAGGSPR